MKTVQIIKTILRWYSGFFVAVMVIMGIVFVKDISIYEQPATIGENIAMLILFLLVFIYIWWEIIDSLRCK